MSTHEFNSKMLSDSHFVNGELRFLLVGNECRLLDNRRTPGVIRSIDLENGFFIWEIADFEDKGKSWEVELENVSNYQFKLGSEKLTELQASAVQKRIDEFNKFESVAENETKKKITLSLINEISVEIESWLLRNSTFIKSGSKIDFQSLTGPVSLQDDLRSYMMSVGLLEIEEKTAASQVLNPYSGDWIRTIQITMAKMGLKNYSGKSIRSKDTYLGVGSLDNREKFVLHRFAFVSCLFRILGITEVELYRAMATDKHWSLPKEPRFWSSWTFNYQVAMDFSNLKPSTRFKNSYLVKRAMPTNQIFMTFLETKEMNRQYKEAEAIVVHEYNDTLFW